MALMIRRIAAQDTLDTHLALDALARVIPAATVAAVLAECGAAGRRTRKLPGLVTVFFCIAMNLPAGDCLAHAFRQLVLGLRWLWPDPAALRVSTGALCQARYRLGARPLAQLCRRVCRPLATPALPGAFLFGLRLLALDGTTLDVPDTPANVRAFGRQASPRGNCAWPRVQVVALVECGTHAICDAGVWRWDADERAAGRRLLRSVGRGVLLLWDRGFHSCATIAATRARGAHFLGRLPATDKPAVVRTLADGTQLVQLRPGDSRRRRRGEAVLVRLIRYTLDDPGRPGHAAEHRLVTSLLNPRVAPAEELVLAYHARWEFELAADEVKTHQRPATPLRSKKPVGVIQEVYALVLAHYVVRAVMVDAAQAHDLAPTRLSFLTTLRLIRTALPDFQRAAPAEHPRLYRQLLADVAAARLLARTNRSNPRVVKQKMGNFRVKGPQHQHWPQPTKPFRAAIALLI
jgi:Insertion element 4 transposase N-terminal/Transposase DDE domain